MKTEQELNKQLEKNQSHDSKKPNETAGFYIQSHIKISDPESGEVFVSQRGN